MIDTMLQTILLVAMILISVALTAVILLQRSEGGALGMGGGPSGFMTARGAGNLLTRATSILAVLFFVRIGHRLRLPEQLIPRPVECYKGGSYGYAC
jgi:protein translocase SecG subunit